MPRFVIAFLFTAVAFAQSAAQNGISLNDLGNRASESGDYTGAADHYREAVQIWRSMGSDYEAHLAGTLMNLATVLCAAGHRIEGAATFEEALALHRRTLGSRHARTISNMNLLATNYLMLGQLEKAEALLNEVLPVVRAELPNDIQMARSLEIQSGVLNRHGKLREAVAPAEEALSIITRITGESSMEAALGYATTAEALRAAGQTDRALPLYRKAQALYEKFLGPSHPRVASVISQQGLIALQEGKLATAEQLMLHAVSVLKESCPGCITELAVAENNLGLLRLKQKRYREAGEVLSEALGLRESFSPLPTPELAASMQSLALARKMEHRDADAASLNRRAAAILAFQ
jgi:tetratricopeptide (TPR) repeat protein